MQKTLATLVLAGVLAQPVQAEDTDMQASHPYVGMWGTQDGRIRHQLLADNRYVEARGTRERAYEGRYEITGDHIEYWTIPASPPTATSSTAFSTTAA